MYDKHRVKKSQTNATNVQKKIKQIFCMGCFVMYVSTFYRPKKYGGVPKQTNMKYVHMIFCNVVKKSQTNATTKKYSTMFI